MLGTFSYASWSCGYVLWSTSWRRLFIILCDCLFLIVLYEVFIFERYKAFVTYMCWKYFFQLWFLFAYWYHLISKVLNLHIYILVSPYLSIKFSLYILQKWTFCYKLLFCGLNSRIYFEFSLYFLTSFLFPVMFIFPVILFFHVIYFHLPE